MIVTCNLARDAIGDTLVDTVDIVSNALRGGYSALAPMRLVHIERHSGGRYETLVRIAHHGPKLYRTKTWQAALRCHRFWVRYAEERRINVIGPATYQAMYGIESHVA